MDRIVIDPQVQHGKPVIKGTRVPVSRIVGGMAGGMTVDQVCTAYGVTSDDVRAALELASRLVDQAQHRPLPA